ncbi:MAG: AI-2E family transporter [Hormoscilla sp. GM7CHS1pb]|nr:AI-2E family transporter [Hormoscilla sp. GM7CHS1pb]
MNIGQWLGFFSLVLSLYILWEIRHIILLIFTAVVLATALNRGVLRLQRYTPLSRNMAVISIVSCTILFFLLFFLLVVPPFIEQIQSLIDLLPNGLKRIGILLDELSRNRPEWMPEPPDLSNLIQELQPFVTQLLGNFYDFFSNSLIAVGQLLLVIVLTIMMSINPQPYRKVFVRLFPSFYRRRVDDILSECEEALGNWFGGIVINSLFVATTCGIGLWFLGVRLVLAHALLAGLFNFIPNFGPILSVISPLTVALLDKNPLGKAGAVLILYLVIQNIESYWLSPTVMQKKVSLLPAVTLLAQITFTAFFGPLGLILALPLAVVAQTWLREVLIEDILDKWTGDQDATESSETPIADSPQDPPIPSPEIQPNQANAES